LTFDFDVHVNLVSISLVKMYRYMVLMWVLLLELNHFDRTSYFRPGKKKLFVQITKDDVGYIYLIYCIVDKFSSKMLVSFPVFINSQLYDNFHVSL